MAKGEIKVMSFIGKFVVAVAMVLVITAPTMTGSGVEVDPQGSIPTAETAQNIDSTTKTLRADTIYIDDLPGFVERGIVSLVGSQVARTYEITEQGGSKRTVYIYRLVGVPGFPGITDSVSGKFIRIDAVDGETVHFMKYKNMEDPQQVAYYTCYTAAYPNCTILVKQTPILTGQ